LSWAWAPAISIARAGTALGQHYFRATIQSFQFQRNINVIANQRLASNPSPLNTTSTLISSMAAVLPHRPTARSRSWPVNNGATRRSLGPTFVAGISFIRPQRLSHSSNNANDMEPRITSPNPANSMAAFIGVSLICQSRNISIRTIIAILNLLNWRRLAA
jgi:hypothetical protein